MVGAGKWTATEDLGVCVCVCVRACVRACAHECGTLCTVLHAYFHSLFENTFLPIAGKKVLSSGDFTSSVRTWYTLNIVFKVRMYTSCV